MNNKIICPYCKIEYDIPLQYQVIFSYFLECKSHNNRVILYSNLISKQRYLTTVRLFTKSNYIIEVYFDHPNRWIDPLKDKMIIIKNNSKIAGLPIDNFLTPENVDQKIKTYLIFQ